MTELGAVTQFRALLAAAMVSKGAAPVYMFSDGVKPITVKPLFADVSMATLQTISGLAGIMPEGIVTMTSPQTGGEVFNLIAAPPSSTKIAVAGLHIRANFNNNTSPGQLRFRIGSDFANGSLAELQRWHDGVAFVPAEEDHVVYISPDEGRRSCELVYFFNRQVNAKSYLTPARLISTGYTASELRPSGAVANLVPNLAPGVRVNTQGPANVSLDLTMLTVDNEVFKQLYAATQWGA